MNDILSHRVFISTRPKGQNEELKNLLLKEGASLLELPTIEILPAELDHEDEQKFSKLESYSWIVFTS